MRWRSKGEFRGKYYAGRWGYFSKAIGLAKEFDVKTVLEIGPYTTSFSSDSDVMDREDFGISNRLILHDVDIIPWPIDNKCYDLVIATQVWEHLKHPKEAFAETTRIAKHAILSFPYKWNSGTREHRGIDDDRIIEMTSSDFSRREIVGRRAIFVWSF